MEKETRKIGKIFSNSFLFIFYSFLEISSMFVPELIEKSKRKQIDWF